MATLKSVSKLEPAMNVARIDLSIIVDLWVHLNVGSDVPDKDELGDVRDIARALKGWLELHGHSIDEIARLIPQAPVGYPTPPGSVPSGARMRVLWRNTRGDLIFVVELGNQRTLVAELRGSSFEMT